EERDEDGIETHEREEEVNLAQRLVHHSAEHLREPVIETCEATEERHREKRIVEMRDDEVSAVQKNVRGRRAQENSSHSADEESRKTAQREQHRSGEDDRATPDAGNHREHNDREGH